MDIWADVRKDPFGGQGQAAARPQPRGPFEGIPGFHGAVGPRHDAKQ